MVNRDNGLRVLGLGDQAGIREIERAYKTRARAVKTLLLGARRAADKDRYRSSLRELVRGRDAALGLVPRRDWHAERVALRGARLLDMLRRALVERLHAGAARGFFGLPPIASRAAVLDAYRLHSRALVRAFANARSDDELVAVRRARGKLRTIRNFALASA